MKNIKNLFKEYLPLNIKKRIRTIINILKSTRENFWILFQKIKKIIKRPSFPDFNKVGVNLHLGCGNINHPAFVNIDGFPFPHVHYIRDISDLSIFENNSVDLIYASHCLEHFHYADIPKVLNEWNRVLKKGGILRLSVPDFDLLLNIFNANGMNPDWIIPQLLGGQNNKYNFHYMVFNKQNLTHKLIESGFQNIIEWLPNTSDMTTFDDFSNYFKEIDKIKYPVSLNIEAYKQ